MTKVSRIALYGCGGMMVGISGFVNADTLPAGATPVSGVVSSDRSCIEGLPLQDGVFVLTDLIKALLQRYEAMFKIWSR